MANLGIVIMALGVVVLVYAAGGAMLGVIGYDEWTGGLVLGGLLMAGGWYVTRGARAR